MLTEKDIRPVPKYILKKIERDTERDCFMSAEEAVAYGLVDQVVSKK